MLIGVALPGTDSVLHSRSQRRVGLSLRPRRVVIHLFQIEPGSLYGGMTQAGRNLFYGYFPTLV